MQGYANMLKTKNSGCRCEEREEEEEFLTVIVSDPHKVGEGMSSYMAYKVSTRYTGIKPMSAFGRQK
jgi:hypothetical protein